MIEIIAEAGVAHNGSPELAFKLVDSAKVAGADIVKFQTFDTDKLVRPESPDRWQLKQLELPRRKFIKLARFAETIDIEFMSTPGDLDSLKFLVEEVGVKRIKIGSDDLTYTPLLQAAIASGLPIILSTGMATTKEIAVALMQLGECQITLLHCVSCYPTAPSDANLMAIGSLDTLFGNRAGIGYSDHTEGVTACIAAAAMGAVMIEKHITLGDRHRCPDHVVSLDQINFKYMVFCVREVEKMLGSGEKEPCAAEKENIVRFRKDRDGFRGLLS